jgi:hypothetical protein
MAVGNGMKNRPCHLGGGTEVFPRPLPHRAKKKKGKDKFTLVNEFIFFLERAW